LKLGIIQGRLSVPDAGHQTTPFDWRKEFTLIDKMNLCHIEWNVDNKRLDSNPIFHEDISKITEKISSVCFDNLVTSDFYNYSFFKSAFVDFLSRLCEQGIYKLTIPLLEESKLDSLERVHKATDLISKALDVDDRIQITVESDGPLDYIKPVVNSSNRIFFTYDTGNLTASNRKHDVYIDALFDKIKNIHLKDRKINQGPSVVHNGDVDFDQIFSILGRNGYEGIFTLQMARGKPGSEKEQVLEYTNRFRGLHEQYF